MSSTDGAADQPYKWDARKTAEKINNRIIDEHGRKLSQHVKDLFTSGNRLWTKDMFKEVESNLSKGIREMMIPSLNGVYLSEEVPSEYPDLAQSGPDPQHNIMTFACYRDMIFEAEGGLEDPDPSNERCEVTEQEIARVTRPLQLRWSTISGITHVDRDELQLAWTETQRNWNQSVNCIELTAILERVTLPCSIKRVVCFGLGSLEAYPSLHELSENDGLPIRSGMTQHAVAVTMATVLGQRLGQDRLPILAQDPIYSSVAKEVLAEAGIQVVGGFGSLGFTHVDDESVVFSCHPNIPVKQIVADIARPALMIWDRVTPIEEENTKWGVSEWDGSAALLSPFCTDDDSPRTRALVEDCEHIPFPNDNERMSGLMVYVRKGNILAV